MTDAAIVLRKLSSLKEQLQRLHRRCPDKWDDLRDDVDKQDALAMSLLVAVQDALDIALHMASDEGWGVPGSYGEGFELLASNGVIEPSLARRLIVTAVLRNRIAHGYASVDFERIWGELPNGIEALETFAASVARHLIVAKP